MKNWNNAITQDSWRILKYNAETITGFEKLLEVGPSISIFGSARTKPDDLYYKKTVEIAKMIAKMGFGVISGAGPGIMEAANKGAKENGGKSVGLRINLPFEQYTNKADVRLRGRAFSLKVNCDTLGVRWRLGSPRVEIRPDGRR